MRSVLIVFLTLGWILPAMAEPKLPLLEPTIQQLLAKPREVRRTHGSGHRPRRFDCLSAIPASKVCEPCSSSRPTVTRFASGH